MGAGNENELNFVREIYLLLMKPIGYKMQTWKLSHRNSNLKKNLRIPSLFPVPSFHTIYQVLVEAGETECRVVGCVGVALVSCCRYRHTGSQWERTTRPVYTGDIGEHTCIPKHKWHTPKFQGVATVWMIFFKWRSEDKKKFINVFDLGGRLVFIVDSSQFLCPQTSTK